MLWPSSTTNFRQWSDSLSHPGLLVLLLVGMHHLALQHRSPDLHLFPDEPRSLGDLLPPFLLP